MNRSLYRLTVLSLKTLPVGMHADGGGLWFRVQPGGRSWVFRYRSRSTGKERLMGLGSFSDVSLAKAREKAAVARQQLHDGLDPLEEKKASKAVVVAERSRTFQETAEGYIQAHRAGWKNAKHADQWRSTLEMHAFPTFGTKPVAQVTVDDVLGALSPIWTTKTETARRVRARIESVLSYAGSRGWRTGANPAAWKGLLEHSLPKPSRVSQIVHHGAVPWRDMPAVMAALARSEGMGALAVRFACLTAARSMEVRAAPWSEIDLPDRMWVIPAARMKMKREHRVPLSGPAIEILEKVRPLASTPTDLVFPGGRPGRPLSDVALSKALHLAAGTKDVTVHGLRSTFRDWCAEATDHPHEVAEMALAHVIANRVEAAYRRGDLFEKRRAVMEEWGRFTQQDRSG